MADSKITALTALTAADPVNDMFPVVDVSDTTMAASGTTKKISVNNILGASGTATLASATITGAATVGTTLGVTGVSTFAAGTAALPALTTTGDTNTGIYYPAADTFAVTTGGTERYRVDSSGNVGIGVTTTGTRRLELKSAGTTNTTFAAHFRDSADTLLFHVRSDGWFNTGQGTLSPYNNTTANAANMFVDSSGFVLRSTSSLKYKTDVKDSIHGLADVLKLRSVTYKSKNGDDTVFGGLIAEEVHAAGLTEFVAYAPDKTPDSINYGNMVALLVSAIKELTARVQTLEAK